MMKYIAILAVFLASAFAIAQEDAAIPVVETDYSSPLTILSGEVEHAFTVEVVSTPDKIQQGMMHRPEMAENVGMLFDLGETRMANFFMRNTLVSLDLLFVSNTGEIISIAHNASPLSERNISSGAPIAYVLEIKGGQASILGINPGDTLRHERLNNTG